MKKTTIVWFRQDLRIEDNPALRWATDRGDVVPVYILDEKNQGVWPLGGATRWWLHYALQDFSELFKKHDVQFILRRGEPLSVLQNLIRQTGATALTWNRCYEPHAIERDKIIKKELQGLGVEVLSHNGNLLIEPWDIKTNSGTFYKVFTPFYKSCLSRTPAKPIANQKILSPQSTLESDALDSWKLLPTKPDWARGFKDFWNPTARGAREQLALFLRISLETYKEGRDRPDKDGTSRLSPFLHFGQLSPRQILSTIYANNIGLGGLSNGAESFVRELYWREFSYYLLYHFPDLPKQSFNQRYNSFPWKDDEAGLRAWQTGTTGYPIVDAGMRQLWQLGWMHNRVRMVVASFLIKDLLIPWQKGEAWFWDTLVDADLASNAASWQWVAGSGADAAPYHRVFNPVLQGKKFDPTGQYVRKFIPELGKLSDRFIHEPWLATEEERANAGVVLGQNYPNRIIDHSVARIRALAALKEMGA